MITAVDTNVLLDVLIPDQEFGPQSSELLARDRGFFATYFPELQGLTPA